MGNEEQPVVELQHLYGQSPLWVAPAGLAEQLA